MNIKIKTKIHPIYILSSAIFKPKSNIKTNARINVALRRKLNINIKIKIYATFSFKIKYLTYNSFSPT